MPINEASMEEMFDTGHTPDEDDISTVAELLGLPEPPETSESHEEHEVAAITPDIEESVLVASLTQDHNHQVAVASGVTDRAVSKPSDVNEEQGGRFRIGDRAVYPAQGVAEVTDVKQMTVNGKTQGFYVLQIMGTNRKVMIPFDNADSAGVRPVIEADQLEEIWGLLRERMTDFTDKPWHRRYKEFIEKLRTGSIFDVVEVLRDITLLSRSKTLSFGENRLLDKARTLLSSEIALVQGRPEDEVKKEIATFFA